MSEEQKIKPCKVRFLRAERLPESIFEPFNKTFFYEVLEPGSCLGEPILESEVVTQTQLKETLKRLKREYRFRAGKFPEQELCIVEEVEQ